MINKSKKILLVDLCDTLYPCNTTVGFVNFVTSGKIYFLNSLFLKVISKIVFKITGFDILRYFFLKKLKGISKEKLLFLARNYIETLTPNDAILQKIERYKKMQYNIFMISASLEPVVESVASKFNFDGFESTTIGYKNNVCTGVITNDLLGRKADRVKNIKSQYVEVAFITDNISDYSCVELCDEFYAVIPKGKRNYFWDERKVKIIKLD